MDSHFSLKFLLHELTALKKTIDELCYEGILNITQVTRLYFLSIEQGKLLISQLCVDKMLRVAYLFVASAD